MNNSVPPNFSKEEERQEEKKDSTHKYFELYKKNLFSALLGLNKDEENIYEIGKVLVRKRAFKGACI